MSPDGSADAGVQAGKASTWDDLRLARLWELVDLLIRNDLARGHITSRIGDGWLRNPKQLELLAPHADDLQSWQACLRCLAAVAGAGGVNRMVVGRQLRALTHHLLHRIDPTAVPRDNACHA
jgi:hypothetical protein